MASYFGRLWSSTSSTQTFSKPTIMSLQCIVQGESPSFEAKVTNSDTINTLKDIIKHSIENSYPNTDAKDLVLWKAKLPTNRKKDIKADSSLEEFLKEFNGMELDDGTISIGRVFPQDPKNKGYIDLSQEGYCHIIVERPHGPQVAPQGLDWNDANSIYSWIQNLKLNRERNLLVKTFGMKFDFLGRDETINTLWNGNDFGGIVARFKNRKNSDKGLHPIPVLAGGPGTGKSRFLDEVERLLIKEVNLSSDEEILDAFTNMVVINTTYGSGSPADNIDQQIGAHTSLALRIIFEYFRPEHEYGEFTFSSFRSICNKGNISSFSLDTALSVICIDYTTRKQIVPNSLLTIVVGIDEFNKLYDVNKELSRVLIHTIGGVMCQPPANIFFVPILAGTIEGPLEIYVRNSMHKPLRLPLPLLNESDALQISNSIGLDQNILEEYIHHHPYFKICIGDIGGHIRTLEFFYEKFTKELAQRDKNPYLVNVSNIMMAVKSKISDQYDLKSYSNLLTEVLAKAILGIEVQEGHTINTGKGPTTSITYLDLSSRGILNLTPSKKINGVDFFKIRIPYLWISILVTASQHYSEMAFWQEMLNYDEPMYWQSFENFNTRFLALRLNLFRLAGYSKVSLKVFLQGAKFSRNFPDVDIILPETFKLCRLRHRYPEDEDSDSDDGDKSTNSSDNNIVIESKIIAGYTRVDRLEDKDIQNYKQYVFRNAPGAPWDLFAFLDMEPSEYFKKTRLFFKQVKKTDPAENVKKTMLLAGQVKKTDPEAIKPMIINDKLFGEEHNKVSEAVSGISVDKHILLFLTNAKSKDLLLNKCENSALVADEEFRNFYGYTYSSRAQFASANEKIYVNSAPIESLKSVGLNDNEANLVYQACSNNKRPHSAITSKEDLEAVAKISSKRARHIYWKRIAY